MAISRGLSSDVSPKAGAVWGAVSAQSKADGCPTQRDNLHPSAEASLSGLLSGLSKKEGLVYFILYLILFCFISFHFILFHFTLFYFCSPNLLK